MSNNIIEVVAKKQLLADLEAYKMWVEENDWDKAQDAALNCYEILQGFLQENLDDFKINNEELIKDILKNGDN